MANFLSPLNMTVYELHYLSWIETVVFSEIDEKTSVALLNSSRLSGRSGASRIPGVSRISRVATLLLANRFLYLRGIGIICKETAELSAYHLLQNIFLVNILEVTTNLCHERFNLLFNNVNLLYLVNSAEELLCTNLLWSWQSTVNKLLAYLLLNSTYFVLLASVDNGDRCSLLASTTSTA